MPAGRLMERGFALLERGSAQSFAYPAGPEALPTVGPDDSHNQPALDSGPAENLATNPPLASSTPTDPIDSSATPTANSTAVVQTDAAPSVSASATTATNIPSLGIQIPTSLSTVIPATVAFIGICILALVVYNVYRWRQRRAARKRKAAVLPRIVVSYEKTEYATKSPTLIHTDGSVDAKSTPIVLAFPTSGDDYSDDEKKTFAVRLPSSPKPAAKPTSAVRHDTQAQWRPIPRPQGTTPRANARTSSLIQSRTSADLEQLAAAERAAHAPAHSRLPRLASVISTFTTTLPDELEVRMGETLRVLEDYADGWCLAERVGSGKSQCGTLPQFCLQDKEEFVPGKRFSLALFGRK